VAVVNESDSETVFDEKRLVGWEEARRDNLSFWIAAEIAPDWFDRHDLFAVGDQRVYGDFYNHGPLAVDQYDFHVTFGAVSRLNGEEKVTYAHVTHDQHLRANIVLFDFHAKDVDDHGHEHHDHEDGHSHDHGQDGRYVAVDKRKLYYGVDLHDQGQHELGHAVDKVRNRCSNYYRLFTKCFSFSLRSIYC